MKSKRLLLMLLVALCAPWAAMAQNTLTVCDGTDNSQYVPFEGYNADAAQHNQMIFPATDLTAMNGKVITQMVFYIDQSASNGSNTSASRLGTWTVSLGETTATTLSGLDNTTTLTQVYQGYFDCSSGTLTLSFTDGYTYHGGNLLVDLNHAAASWNRWYFLGVNQSGVTAITRGSNYQFLPKTTFTYETPATCPKPTGLTCTTYTATTATLGWTENGEATQWELEYSTDNTFAATQTTTVSNNPTTQLTGLTAEQTYYARVKADCGGGDQSDWSSVCEFKPSAALYIGNGTSTGGSTPLVGNYKSSYDQMIYTASQLQAVGINAAGSITKIGFNSSAANTIARNVKIYMGHTDKTSFSNNTDFIAYNDLTLVYDYSATGNGQWNITAGWNEFELDTPFDYDGNSNLVIAMHCGLASDYSSSSFYYTATSSNQVVYAYSDSYDPVPSTFDPSSYSGSKNTTTQLPNLKLFIEITSTPKPTHLTVSHETASSATVSWQAPASATPTGYEFMYKEASSSTWPSSWTSSNGQTSVDLTGLSANTTYDFRVRAVYGTDYSDPAETSFTTLATCLVPEGLAVSNMVATWTAGAASQWNLQYKRSADTEWTPVNGLTAATYDFNNLTLDANTDYDVQVQADCGSGDLSEWTATVTFRTPCGAISTLPWSENFDDYTVASNYTAPSERVLPSCWSAINTTTYSSYKQLPSIYYYSSTNYANSTPNCLKFYSYAYYSSGTTTYDPQPQYAILPEMSNLAGKEVVLYARGYNTSSTFKIGTMSDPDDASTFNLINEQEGLTTSYQKFSYIIPDDCTNSYLAIMIDAATSSRTTNGVYIDDITVKEMVTVDADEIVASNPGEGQMTWSQFVQHWNNGDHFTHTTFTLMENITITEMVGTTENPFSGTFDGNGRTITLNYNATENYCAPFRYVRNATIQNLTVGGTINTANQFAGGFVGDCFGNNTLTNCVSNVTINSTKSGDGTHGGFIGRNSGGGTVNLTGCAFTGRLLGSSTTNCAGLVGWTENGYYGSSSHTIFTNCVFAPAEVTIDISGSYTFSRIYGSNNTPVTFNNCYYTQTFGTEQGKLKYDITAETGITATMSGEPTEYDMSGITAYAGNTGLLYNTTIIAGDGETVSLTLSGAAGYEANHGTLVANGDVFTLTMEAYNTTISGVDCPVPYNVAVPAATLAARSAQVTWDGGSDSYTMEYREVITPAVDVNDTYGFEDNTLQGWTTISNDNDNNAWSVQSGSSYAHEGSYCVRSRYTGSGVGIPNDWLISPQIPLGGTLSFYAKRYSTTYTDQFQVYVSTTGNSISDFTAISEVITPTASYELYEYDLSSYSGNGYVAIVYTGLENQYYVYVDDITYTVSIEGEYGEWQPISNATSPQTINNLTPETTYEVRVKGICAGTETEYSDVVSFTTPASCVAPTGLAVSGITATGASFSWDAEEGATWQYCTFTLPHADPTDADFSSSTIYNTASWPNAFIPSTQQIFWLRKDCGNGEYSQPVSVEFTMLDACVNLTCTAVTTITATLSWTDNAYGVNSWQVMLNNDAEHPITVTTNPCTLTGLTAATAYTAKVRAAHGNCVGGYTDWSNEVSFTTDCGAIALPYTYGFEDAGQLACWTMTDCISGTGINSSANHTGSYGFAFHWLEESQQCLISPEFESTTAQVAVSFYYKNPSTGYDETFLVGYSTPTNDVAAFTWGDEITIAAGENDWTPYNDVFPAGTKYVALKHTSDDAYYLYVDDFSFQPVFTKIIEAVGEEGWANGKGGYYLIASPLAEDVTPNADNGFITDNYDLYYFSQTGDSEGNEWINYKDTENGGFSIVNGTGYLYASKEGTTLTFTGAPYSGNGEVTVTLSVAENTDNLGAVNLVGNPFAVDAYITKSFYTLENSDTYTVNTSSDAIQPMQGLLVVADEDGETLTFTPAEAPTGSKAKLNMNVSKDRSVVDQAIISFNEGQQLPKLQFRNGSTKVYIPQDGKDYAIVSAESMGTMPVSFKAEENGTYTLNFTNEEVTFNYLHLIDNLTGTETDLLANPSYTFDARTTDYENRFKLVFATGNNANDDAFAFYSNGGFVINNEGNATLQVIDMNGRILKSESINGCANVNVKAAAGVYMLRLVNGNDVKVQKVVVR